MTAAFILKYQTGALTSSPTPSCWRLAARAGQNSDRLVTGLTLSAKQRREYCAAAPGQLWIHRFWSDIFRDRFGGHPLKRIALSTTAQLVRGEAACHTRRH